MLSGRKILLVLGAFSAFLAAVLFAVAAAGLSAADLVRDTTDTAKLPWWTGGFARLGISMWLVAAAFCVLAGIVVQRASRDRAIFFFVTAGLLTLLSFDDSFQIHEVVAPAHLGISEYAIYAVIAVAASLWAVRFRREILESRLWLLGLAAIMLFGSVSSDVIERGSAAAEDWLKLTGIAALALWCADTGIAAIWDAIGSTQADGSED